MVMLVEEVQSKPAEIIKAAIKNSPATKKPSMRLSAKVDKAPKDTNQKTDDGLKPDPYQGTTTGKSTRKRSVKGNKAPKDANQKTDNGLKLTPYEGHMKCFGLYRCDKCKKNWASPNSWADSYQKCKGCNGHIYPHTQFPLEEGKGRKKGTPPHPQDLCQKCMQLGTFCGVYGKTSKQNKYGKTSKQKRRYEREE